MNPAEISILAEACRTADELSRLERAVRALPSLVTVGSVGQEKAHPLLEEVRWHRVLLERLVASLALPDDEDERGRTPARNMLRKPLVRVGMSTTLGMRRCLDGCASSCAACVGSCGVVVA